MWKPISLLVTCVSLGLAERGSGSDWAQFRGPNASGRDTTTSTLPVDLGPNGNVLWKTALPPGHSSPVLAGGRLYLTAVRDKALLTMAIDPLDGRVLWQAEAPSRTPEQVHQIGSHAQPTPAADGERVVSFFGSSGLYCYSRDGKPLWKHAMGPFNNTFGAGSSPILVAGRVVLCQDHDMNSFLMSVDVRTGKVIWKTDRSEYLRGFATPVIWEVAGRKQVVVAGTLRVTGYGWDDGKEIWTVRGVARTAVATPVFGADGSLFVAGWAAGGDPGAPIKVEPFDSVIKVLDKNGNGKLEASEIVSGPIAERFPQVDFDRDGSITRAEYERFRELFEKGENVVLAIRPGGRGDITSSHVLWRNRKNVPFCASPLYLDGLLYTLKDRGLFACLDARDGKPIKVARLPAGGNYYSSPVTGDGKIYLLSQDGEWTVLRAGRKWEVLASGSFNEQAYATPAIAEGRLYVRTAGHLYCFKQK